MSAAIQWNAVLVSSGLIAGLLIAFIVWYFSPSLPTLYGTVTINGTPCEEFDVELTAADGAHWKRRNGGGVYRLLDVPRGKATVVVTLIPSKAPGQHKFTIQCDITRSFAELSIDVPLRFSDFSLSSSDDGSATLSSIRLALDESQMIACRGASATVQDLQLQFEAAVSPRSRDSITPKVATQQFSATQAHKEARWSTETKLPSGAYRAQLTLVGATPSSVKIITV